MDAVMPPPARRIRPPRCRGTVEDHQKVALDVRELTRQRVFDAPVGTVWRQCAFRSPWLRTMRLDWANLILELATGRTETIPFAWTRCGAFGNRFRFLCPHCHRRVCLLYHLDGQVLCRTCGGLWYGAQRISSAGRKMLAMEKIRTKLGDYGQIPSWKVPPKPRGMWRKKYARHLASLARIERSLYRERRRPSARLTAAAG
jgi:hypothetical protein